MFDPNQEQEKDGEFADEGKGRSDGLTEGSSGSKIENSKDNKNISKMRDAQLQKSIKTWSKRIEEHQEKIRVLKRH